MDVGNNKEKSFRSEQKNNDLQKRKKIQQNAQK